MSPVFPELPKEIGIYTLTRLLESGAHTDLYIARQNLVEREVVMEVLRPESTEKDVEDFLESGRLRVAAAGMPHVAQVLESRQENGVWFIIHELPPGYCYQDIVAARQRISPRHCCRTISHAAEIYTFCTKRGLDTLNISPAGTFLTAEGGVQFLSPVTASGRGTGIAEQMSALSRMLAPTRPVDVSGATRCASLLRWMQNDAAADSYDWASIGTTADTVISQLQEAEPLLEMPQPQVSDATLRRQRRHTRRALLRLGALGATALVVATCIASLGAMLIPMEKEHAIAPVHDGYAYCRDGKKKLAVSTAMVSVAQYADFLQQLESMTLDKLEAINQGIPENCRNHTPDEWDKQQRAATTRSAFHGRNLRPDSPVTGISYWDALAYARAKGGSIPTAPVLQAARSRMAATRVQEWTSSESPESLLRLYAAGCPLVADKDGTPPRLIPVKSPELRSFTLGFRIALPVNKAK